MCALTNGPLIHKASTRATTKHGIFFRSVVLPSSRRRMRISLLGTETTPNAAIGVLAIISRPGHIVNRSAHNMRSTWASAWWEGNYPDFSNELQTPEREPSRARKLAHICILPPQLHTKRHTGPLSRLGLGASASKPTREAIVPSGPCTSAPMSVRVPGGLPGPLSQ